MFSHKTGQTQLLGNKTVIVSHLQRIVKYNANHCKFSVINIKTQEIVCNLIDQSDEIQNTSTLNIKTQRRNLCM